MSTIETSNLTGQSVSYWATNGDLLKIEVVQKYIASQDFNNLTCKIKSELWFRLLYDNDPRYDGHTFSDYAIYLGGKYFNLKNGSSTNALEISSNVGIQVNGVVINSNAYTSTKIMEKEYTFPLSKDGRNKFWIYNGQYGIDNLGEPYLVTDADSQDIYLTLPSFSGMHIKTNNQIKTCMPHIKKNGVWKPCLQYVRVNGVWKRCQ